MRKLIVILIFSCIVAVSSALCSCNQNDGEIGPLYGLWSLTEFSFGDVNVSGEMCDGHSLRFQSNVVQYVENLPYHDSQMFIGSWQIKSDSLLLNFPDVSNDHGYRLFDKKKVTDDYVKVDFPISTSLGFKIRTLSNSVLDISRTTSEGVEVRYYFRKLN